LREKRKEAYEGKGKVSKPTKYLYELKKQDEGIKGSRMGRGKWAETWALLQSEKKGKRGKG